ncbi:MAG: ABC transporter permease, partial [Propionibacteriaceae bacterium]|nr:ABC transporter permease [Propionibacteriaceae bacterium]
MSVTDPRFGELGQVDEKQLALLMRDWRRGRADRNIWQALSDGYVFVFALVMIGAMLVSSIIQAQQVVAVCDTAGCLAARGLLP